MSTQIDHTPPPATHADPRRWIGLAVLCASLLIVVMDLTILNVALPSISSDLRPSSVELLWMVDVYALAVGGFIVVASGLADRFGRRRMLLIGYVVFGAVPLLVLVVDSPAWLIALRALLGLGGALIMPSTMSMIRNLFDDARERAVALGLWATMAAVGAGLGPIIGGALLQHFTWHAAFLFNTPVMVAAIVAATLLLPENFGAKVRWDSPGVVASVVGMTATIYAIKSFGKDGFDAAGAWAAVVVAAIALTWFARRCLNSEQPLLDVRLLRRPALTAGLVAALMSSVAFAALMLLLTQWMQLVEDYSPLRTGVYLLPFAVAAGVLSPFAPRVADWIGARTVMVGGLALSGAGFFVLYLGGPTLTYPTAALCLTLTGAGTASLAIGSAVIMSTAPAERSGNAAVMEETSFEFGSALGVAVLGSLAAAVYRNLLPHSTLSALGITGPAAETSRESIGGAVAVAEGLGDGGGALAQRAQEAFTDALVVSGLAGGAVMIAAAALVWFMTPRDLSVEGGGH
ncbi:MAG: MFS transporter [Stackebrandtia sp.]